jgi:hypothetical protein
MSIIIQNMKGDALGVCTYQLRINQRVIAEFEHSRPDGLAVCLKKAADAAEQDEWEGLQQVIEEVWR